MSGPSEARSRGGALQTPAPSALATRRGLGRASQGYLFDPNYYRLGYQLAAQRLNSAIQRLAQLRTPTLPEGHDDETQASGVGPQLARLRAEEREVARQKDDIARWRCHRELELARDDGLELTARASETIESIANLPGRLSWIGLHARPNAQQRRLRRFLIETVVPCSELVVAGTFAALQSRGQAERHAGPIREQVKSGRASYRAAYNLACYELAASDGEPSEESTAWALEALRIALKEAPQQPSTLGPARMGTQRPSARARAALEGVRQAARELCDQRTRVRADRVGARRGEPQFEMTVDALPHRKI